MKVPRTPDSYFEDLREFNFEPYYTNIPIAAGTEVRIRHIEEGPKYGRLVVMIQWANILAL